ncbi:MAG: MFS transporter [Bacillota bacterium]|nr:MFS transporter [Bacillota bacterium]
MNFERNIKTYYFYSTFAELLILGPVMTLFLIAKGCSFTEIMLLQSISAITQVLFEVPTGAVADKQGRKVSILLSSAIWAISLFIYIIGKTFIVFAAAETIFSLGASLKSGADSALIYDSLVSVKKEGEYQKVEGKARSYALYAQAIGSVLSGFIYEVNIYLPMAVSIIFMIVTFIITLFFYEPPYQKETQHEGVNYYRQISDSSRYIFKHEKLKAVVLFCTVFFIFYRAGFWYYQPYMEAVNIPVKYFGIIFFLFNITAAFISKRSHYIMEKTKPRTLSFLALLMGASFFLMGTVKIWPGFLAILLQQVARGLYGPVTTKYINKHIPSDKRATILSFSSLSCNIAVAVTFPFMGMLKDHADIFSTHLVLTAAMVISMGACTRYMNKRIGKRRGADTLTLKP